MAFTDDDLLVAVFATHGKSQVDIAEMIDKDATFVNKRLKKAAQNQLLRKSHPTINEELVEPDRLERIRAKVSELLALKLGFADSRTELKGRLRPLSGGWLRDVTITACPRRLRGKTDRASWDLRIRSLADASLPRLAELMPKMRVVAVPWGQTGRALADSLKDAVKTKQLELSPPKPPIQFVPLGGEPVVTGTPYPLALSASVIAMELSEIVNGSESRVQVPSLTGVPAFIPAACGDDAAALRRFFSSNEYYKKIFGPSDDQRGTGLIQKLDTIIVSVAGASFEYREGSPSVKARLEAEGLEKWRESIVGDMAGVWLAEDDSGTFEDMEKRSLCVRAQDFKECARKAEAQPKKRPGVIVLAHGKSKARALLAAIKKQYVTEIVIDNELADALIALCSDGNST